jgi:hypothetical protein
MLSKKEQKRLERIKSKETTIKSFKRTLNYLNEQKDLLNSLSDLSEEEYAFESSFLDEKINSVYKRIELCSQELKLLKREDNKC